MITEITIYSDDNLKRVTYRVGNEQPQIIVNLSSTLQSGVDALLTYVSTLKTPTEKTNIALDFIKANATDAQKLVMIALYQFWTVSKPYIIGDEIQYKGMLYRVIQAHTSQLNWTPDIVPALFTKIVPPDVIPQWIQPTGAHDAYALGAKVLFNGKTYESLITANTYSPTAYPAGWKLIG